MTEPILEAKNLRKTYRRGRGERVCALDQVSFRLTQGQCLGIVGESGCGKSTLCRLLAGLERPDSGQVLLGGSPVSAKGLWGLGRPGFGGQIQIVFQNSLDAVNLYTDVFHTISEPLVNFFHMDRRACERETAALLRKVGLSGEDMRKYPAQFSGGQLQRICIARALAARPKVLLLDEPLSSLDVSVQAQILNLLADLKQELDLTCVLISHDLKAVYYLADALLVMKEGRVVESFETIRDLPRGKHPYTRQLFAAHDLGGQERTSCFFSQ